LQEPANFRRADDRRQTKKDHLMPTSTLMLWRAMALDAAGGRQQQRYDAHSVAERQAFKRWTERMRTPAFALDQDRRFAEGRQGRQRSA
jgi:hypothetical protein